MEKELAAVIARAAGRDDEAVARAREAVALEQELPAPLGPPRPIKPAPELLGELLLELKRPKEAATEFARALARWPNRSRSLLGLARAAAGSGDTVAARHQYEQLLLNWRNADPELPELTEARRFLGARR